MNYNIIVDNGDYEPYMERYATSEASAMKLANQTANEYQDYNVYVKVFRASDQQHMFLNRDGFALTGHSWTK